MSQTPNDPQGRSPVDPFASATAPPPPPPGYGPAYAYPPPPPPRRGGNILMRVVTGLVTTLLLSSVLLNVYLLVLVVAMTSGPSEQVYADGDKTRRIVILPVTGVIDDAQARFVRTGLKVLRDNPPAAIILRVESGGGGVSASDVIWHQIGLFKKEFPDVPIIASFGGLAASGGYYISADSDFIFAEPTGITGSIGVIAPAFTVDKLLEKIGVTPEVITATPSTQKDVANNIMRPWNDQDRQALRGLLDHMAERFIDVVHQGRGRVAQLTREEVEALANGAIFTAQEAKANCLIDEVGYLDDAIAKAKEKAGIDAAVKPEVTVISLPRSLGLASLLGSADPPTGRSLTDVITPEQARSWLTELAQFRLEYRWAP